MKKDKFISLSCYVLIVFLLIFSILGKLTNYYVSAFLILLLALIPLFIRFEAKKVNSKEIALVAMLVTVASVLRIPFSIIPSLQPVTFIVIVTGIVFGKDLGFITGTSIALLSNIFLGHGPWTPWQMFSWGIVGYVSGLLNRWNFFNSRKFLLAYCFLWGYFYGWIMNLWFWLAYVYPLNLQSFILANSLSFIFDSIHAVGNLAFALIFYNDLISILKKFKIKYNLN